ncbi:hypothetical protein ACISU4_01130 [Streptomyces wuyuanensis]|uniref:hypothetical protein n=1 Tax=Streptomyces wuyuanensis TaxID=1196353 RepID=UPI0038306A04
MRQDRPLPQLRSQLALSRGSGRFAGIDNDEELRLVSRAIIERLARAMVRVLAHTP